MRKILNILLVIVLTLSLSGCNEIKHKELFKITDKVVESLYTEYESYGMFGGKEEYTSDREYKVMPIGRLVNVRTEPEATDKAYDDSLADLQSHYKGNSHVNQVYRCQAGTLMIDCRN